jgi:microcystin-dependent protein
MRFIATPAGIVPASSSQPQAEPQRRGWLKRFGALLGGGLLASPVLAGTRSVVSTQGMDPFIGEIMLFAGNFAPRGYMLCQGQILSIAQNSALFAVLGTTYGGDGQTTFALPNLQGRFPMQQGQGPGLSYRNLGEIAGTETVTLNSTQMPAHTHQLTASTTAGNSDSPSGNLLANNGRGGPQFTSAGSVNTTMHPQSVGIAGGNQPHENMPPYLALNFCIAVSGIFPSRD